MAKPKWFVEDKGDPSVGIWGYCEDFDSDQALIDWINNGMEGMFDEENGTNVFTIEEAISFCRNDLGAAVYRAEWKCPKHPEQLTNWGCNECEYEAYKSWEEIREEYDRSYNDGP